MKTDTRARKHLPELEIGTLTQDIEGLSAKIDDKTEENICNSLKMGVKPEN